MTLFVSKQVLVPIDFLDEADKALEETLEYEAINAQWPALAKMTLAECGVPSGQGRDLRKGACHLCKYSNLTSGQ
jgi:hypothetical protein